MPTNSDTPLPTPSPSAHVVELLAPAGDATALEAALAAGADAVYFGLTTLNARRGAANFAPEALDDTVALIHAAGARAHLTLNIDLNPRETGQAARALELARRAGVDAVLVRDPAFLRLRGAFPEIAFHWSTQAGVANAAGVAAAQALGIDRVVLARELTLEEIRAAAAVGVGIEVFAQGALCFSASGRCLLSSWVGGRSGNRGVCASPCRVPWRVDGRDVGRPFSMHDLGLLDRLDALRAAGVCCLKIEGRLKTADWVGRAVRLYRAVLDGTPAEDLADEAAALGAYTGRRLTSGYLDGRRTDLVGESGRAPAEERSAPTGEDDGAAAASAGDAPGGDAPAYRLRLETASGRLVCICSAEGEEERWTLPLTVVRRPKKAISLADLGKALAAQAIQGRRLDAFTTDDPERLVPPKTANAVSDRLSAALHRAGRQAPDAIRLDLPDAVREALAPGPVDAAETLTLGEPPNRARLRADQLDAVAHNLPEPDLVVEGLTAKTLRRWAGRLGPERLLAALPPVFYEDETAGLKALAAAAVAEGVALEVNDWGGWRIGREAEARLVAGPGLPVLNPLAGRALADLGCEAATASVEADRRNLEELTAEAPIPLQLVVYGHPVLAVTRAALPADLAAGRTVADERGLRLRPERDAGGRTAFRSLDPFDLSDCRNRRIRARWLVADLTGSADPAGDWYALGQRRRGKKRFNLDRTLH
ncbi:MAG: peptidase U32 family protein [Planctomycetota bacterium]